MNDMTGPAQYLVSLLLHAGGVALSILGVLPHKHFHQGARRA